MDWVAIACISTTSFIGGAVGGAVMDYWKRKRSVPLSVPVLAYSEIDDGAAAESQLVELRGIRDLEPLDDDIMSIVALMGEEPAVAGSHS